MNKGVDKNVRKRITNTRNNRKQCFSNSKRPLRKNRVVFGNGKSFIKKICQKRYCKARKT